MLGKRFCFKVEKNIIFSKLSIQNDEMEDFERFLQNLPFRHFKLKL